MQKRGVDLRVLRHLANGHPPEAMPGEVILGGIEDALLHVGRRVRLQRPASTDLAAFGAHDFDCAVA
jgi:hypothetical protein